MPGKLDIINAALAKIGRSRVAALDEDDAALQAALAAWEHCVRESLMAAPWTFAVRWARLARHDDAPPFGPGASFALPADCLRVVALRDAGDPAGAPLVCSVVGRAVYADADAVECRYLSADSAPESWPADFAELAALRLGAETASLAAQNPALAENLLALYQAALPAVAVRDAATENPAGPDALEAVGQASFLAAR